MGRSITPRRILVPTPKIVRRAKLRLYEGWSFMAVGLLVWIGAFCAAYLLLD